ncbi:hypothetical protein WICPIJ_003993 [Wickerhamomyces pijperi]|uniref:Uncharacterized protein n=1 Tax=Wickerhamomyces pijperi TaxID=599730 RepID=A0A9P8TNR0_WICPI|nr:hypothetical protein WICPIJ_003993 [Wickerhamomyces pijperi]
MTNQTISEVFQEFQEDIESIKGTLKGYKTLVMKLQDFNTSNNQQSNIDSKQKLINQTTMFQTMVFQNIQVLYDRVDEICQDFEKPGEEGTTDNKRKFIKEVDLIHEQFINIKTTFESLLQ